MELLRGASLNFGSPPTLPAKNKNPPKKGKDKFPKYTFIQKDIKIRTSSIKPVGPS